MSVRDPARPAIERSSIFRLVWREPRQGPPPEVQGVWAWRRSIGPTFPSDARRSRAWSNRTLDGSVPDWNLISHPTAPAGRAERPASC